MPLRFIDRQGRHISSEGWLHYSCDSHYCRVLDTGTRDVRVETTWVGLTTDWAARPALFCTEVLKIKEDGDWETLHVTWTDTEHQAKQEHEKLELQHLNS